MGQAKVFVFKPVELPVCHGLKHELLACYCYRHVTADRICIGGSRARRPLVLCTARAWRGRTAAFRPLRPPCRHAWAIERWRCQGTGSGANQRLGRRDPRADLWPDLPICGPVGPVRHDVNSNFVRTEPASRTALTSSSRLQSSSSTHVTPISIVFNLFFYFARRKHMLYTS